MMRYDRHTIKCLPMHNKNHFYPLKIKEVEKLTFEVTLKVPPYYCILDSQKIKIDRSHHHQSE